MRHIWLLAEESELDGLKWRLRTQCTALGIFPAIQGFSQPAALFEALHLGAVDCVITSLAGVAGLNAMEYLRRLNPDCALIWASDLDFSFQAYRLRVDHFILGPPKEEALLEGLTQCMERRGPLGLTEP